MRILVFGDMHGNLSPKIKDFVDENNIDVLICTGDFHPFNPELRRLLLDNSEKLSKIAHERHCSQNKALEILVGKAKVRKLMQGATKGVQEIFKILSQTGKPIFAVFGNVDYHRRNRLLARARAIKKFRFLDSDTVTFQGFRILALDDYRPLSDKAKNKIESKMKKLASVEPKRTIFLSHYPPANTKADKCPTGHVGSIFARELIKRYQPPLYLCGHIHESKTISKLGSTTIVNPGPTPSVAVIDIDGTVKAKLDSL